MRSVLATIAVATAALVSAQVVPENVRNIVALREAAVTKVAVEAKNAFNRRCASDVRSCSTCSPDACTDAAKSYSCNKDFGTPSLCADNSGRRLDSTLSTVRVPPGVSMTTGDVKEDVCYGLRIDNAFKANLANDSDTKWQYFATTSGVHRTFPSRAWSTGSDGTCSSYDPRERPWFVAASSGPKNVVLIIDRSGSMNLESPTRWERAVSAAKAVISALGPSDFLSVVLFSSVGDTLTWNSRLQAATSSNKASATSWLDRQSASGGTYFHEGFRAAVDILRRSRDAEVFTPCQTAVLFLTDGLASETESSTPNRGDIRALAGTVASDYNGTLFTFSFGSGADATFPQQLACLGKGLWSGISSSGNLRTQMLGYYRFLAAARAQESVVWSEPFQDATGLGEIVTAARAVFEVPSGGGIALLVGVAGVDVKLTDIQSAGADRATFLRYIASKSSKCAAFDPTFCELQRLRGLQSPQAVCPAGNVTCPPINVEERTSCASGITASSGACSANAQSEANQGEAQCCEGAAPLNSLTVGLIVAGAVVALCICFCGWRIASRRMAASAAAANKPPVSSSSAASQPAERAALGSRAAHTPAPAPSPAPPPAPAHYPPPVPSVGGYPPAGGGYPGAGPSAPYPGGGPAPYPGGTAPPAAYPGGAPTGGAYPAPYPGSQPSGNTGGVML